MRRVRDERLPGASSGGFQSREMGQRRRRSDETPIGILLRLERPAIMRIGRAPAGFLLTGYLFALDRGTGKAGLISSREWGRLERSQQVR